MDGGHGSINHTLTSIWMAFRRKSNSDKVYIKFKEVEFLAANIQFTNLRFVLVRREMMIIVSECSKMDGS